MRRLTRLLVDVTDGADATFAYETDHSIYSKSGWQIALDCDAGTVTATIEGTLTDDGTLPGAITNWLDITDDMFGVTSLISAAAPAADIWIDDTGATGLFKYLRIVIVANTGATTGDWRIEHIRVK